MENSTIRFPVKCPCCDQEYLVVSKLVTIAHALAGERQLILSSTCAYHRVMWVANEIERGQIREYAAALRFSRRERSRGRSTACPPWRVRTESSSRATRIKGSDA